MAKPAAKRDYKDVDAKTGLGTLIVKVDGEEGKERKTSVKNVASNAKSFAAFVASALSTYVDKPETDDARQKNAPLDSLFSIYTRGVESAARVSFKSKHNTVVNLGGGRKVDLVEFAEKRGIPATIALINGRFDTLNTLQFLEETPTSEEKAAMRKREAGWFNMAEQMVAAGKATMVNDKLVAA